MQGPAHLTISWFVGEACGLDDARDRRIVGLAGLAPDADVLAYIGAYVFFGFDLDRAYKEVWIVVHHCYTHGVGFAVLTGIVAYIIASRLQRGMPENRQRSHALFVAGLAMLVSLTHVFCDVVAAGPRFPVFPWWPFSDLPWTTSWSWELRDWPNQLITFGAFAATLLYARAAGRSPLESLSFRLDTWVVTIVTQGSSQPSLEARARVLGMQRSTLVRLVVYAVLAIATAAIVYPISSELF